MLLTNNEIFRGGPQALVREEIVMRRANIKFDAAFTSGSYSSFKALISEMPLLGDTVDLVHRNLRDRRITPLPLERFFLYEPEGNDFRGFHSKFSHGFRYLDLVGHAVAVASKDREPIPVIVDAVRAYVHDCFHNATFRSFRRGSDGEIYREQYGFNFRKQTGISYSKPAPPTQEFINLNVLMDGIVVLKTAEIMECALAQCARRAKFDLPGNLVNDVLANYADIDAAHFATAFHQCVTKPTVAFLEHYDYPKMFDCLFNAMISGKMADLTCIFRQISGRSWGEIFRSHSFGSDRRVRATMQSELAECRAGGCEG